MKERIRVSIPQEDLASLPIKAIEPFLVGRLQAAGIPIEGALLLGGVTIGRLTCWESLKDKTVNYMWES